MVSSHNASDENYQASQSHTGDFKLNDNHIEIEYQYGDSRFRGVGPADIVTMHASAFHAALDAPFRDHGHKKLAVKVAPDQLPLFQENDPLPSGNDSGSDTAVSLELAVSHSTDFLTSYLQYNTKTQKQQLMVVTELADKPAGAKGLGLNEYRHYYDLLADIPVSLPANFTARLTELVEDGLMRRHDDGTYTLTYKGKQLVETLLIAKQN